MIETIIWHIISAAAWFCAGYFTSKLKYLSKIKEIAQRQRTNPWEMLFELNHGLPINKALEYRHCIYLQYENNHRIYIHLGKVTDDQMRKEIIDKLNDIISGKYATL